MTTDHIARFITRWSQSSGSEKANHQSFVKELCDMLGVSHPDPVCSRGDDQYVFEKLVTVPGDDGVPQKGWIDCYKRGCFVLEAKQASAEGPNRRGTANHQSRLLKARKQAEGYVRALDPGREPSVPFLIVLDVGGSFDLFVDFTGVNRFWVPFPDAQRNRISITALADSSTRALLARIWNDPYGLDPSRQAQVVTCDAAERLAVIARQMESSGHPAERVASFLMRYFFCSFAEDVGLMSVHQFTDLLRSFRGKAAHVQAALETLWRELDQGGFSQALRAEVLHFNGGLFSDGYALPITEEQLTLLIATSELDWSLVEPAIFGTLLERALDPRERHRLGAHFTPRAYVDRLVSATIVEPLRAEWQRVQDVVLDLVDECGSPGSKGTALALIAGYTGSEIKRAVRKRSAAANVDDRQQVARQLVTSFHARLSRVTVLDPACGSGNFLYVALERLKQLEGEVLALEARIGGGGERIALAQLDVDPRNFRGLEINPRAAKIAELVLWIGYLQWYRRNRGVDAGVLGHQWPDPVLHAYHNIEHRDAVIEWTSTHETGSTRWDGVTKKAHPTTGHLVPAIDGHIHVQGYGGVTCAQWPAAEFIIGNPPFIGAGAMRDALGDGYVEAVRTAWSAVPESADFVMYWWHHAAVLVHQRVTRRFGFITTNSITQTFNRRVVQSAMAENLRICWAIPDHPWVDSTNGAAVRVAMTVGELNDGQNNANDGVLLRVVSETDVNADIPAVVYSETRGAINSDMTIGADVTTAVTLRSNERLASEGMKPHGEGFLVTREQAQALGLGTDPVAASLIRPYRNGRDMTHHSRDLFIIDAFEKTDDELRLCAPAIYQHILEHVKPERDHNNREAYRKKWWIFGEPRRDYRPALHGLKRYIATVKTARHRVFQFLDQALLADSKLIMFASDDAYVLGILSSRIHCVWATATGGHLGVGNDPTYAVTASFGTFPFPDPNSSLRQRICALAEEMDAHRKLSLRHPDVTLTSMYNIIEKVRAGEALTPNEKTIHTLGLCAVLQDVHQRLDAAVAEAYGWPAGMSDADVLARVVALNKYRATEESRDSIIRWLRPAYQQSCVTRTPRSKRNK